MFIAERAGSLDHVGLQLEDKVFFLYMEAHGLEAAMPRGCRLGAATARQRANGCWNKQLGNDDCKLPWEVWVLMEALPRQAVRSRSRATCV
jgi:hypothetical protein